MGRIGALIPVISLAVGIIVGAMADLNWWWGIIFIVMAVVVYLAIMHYSGDPVKAFRFGKWHIAWVILIFLGVGSLDEYLNRPVALKDIYGSKMPDYVSGEITNVLSKTYGDKLEVAIDGTNGAKAQIRTGATALSEGDLITFPSEKLTEIASDSSEMIRNIAPMLESKGILYSAFVPSKNIKRTGHVNSIRNVCIRIRNAIEIKIENSHLKKETSGFLKAILMGDKNGLNEETRLTFVHGGTAHMLALSGLHMGILAGLLMWLMWPARALGKYKWGYALAIIMLWCYVFITGMSHSSVRACIMITFAFIAVIFERKNNVGHALCCACMLILIMNPSAIFDVGFQLSVVCVASLIAFASRLNPIRRRQHPILFRVCEALLTTIVATVASWAFISYYFRQVPLMFLPTNVLLLPLLPLYLSISVIFVTLLCMGIEFGVLGMILDQGYKFLMWATDKLSFGSEFVVPYQIPLWGLAIWIIFIAFAAWILNRNRINQVI